MRGALLLYLLGAGVALSSQRGAAVIAVPSGAGSALDALSDAVDDAVSSVAGWSLPARAEPYRSTVAAAETVNGLPHNLLARLLYEESRYRADVIDGSVPSSAGALGIAQFLPATAAELRVNPLDADAAIAAAGRYLAQLYRRFGDWRDALAAYNWGQGNVARYGRAAAPAETLAFVDAIAGDVNVNV